MAADQADGASERRLARERRARREAEVIAENAIRELHESVQELQRSKAVLDETTDFVVIAGIDGGVQYMNRALLELLGLDDGDIGSLRVVDLLTADARTTFETQALATLEEKGLWRGELCLALPSTGREMPVSQVLIGHRGIDGVLDGMSSISRDISEQVAMEAQLTELALHDPLTGLPNRRLFLDRFEVAAARTARSHDPLALMYMDIDRFKGVNDTYGHEAGDDLLIAVAGRIVGCLRGSDTVCRLGGDEFCVLSEHVGTAERAVIVAERIASTVGIPVQLGRHQLTVTLSIGVAVTTEAPDGMEPLLREADAAMYEAKRAGRARVQLSAGSAT